MKVKITGTGSCLPKLRVTNDDLGQIMETSDEWIRSRTGIIARHIAVEETTTGMSTEAADKALKNADISGRDRTWIYKDGKNSKWSLNVEA